MQGNVEKSKGVGTPHYAEKIGGQKPDVSGDLSFFFRCSVGGEVDFFLVGV